jgi:hypothetical protein
MKLKNMSGGRFEYNQYRIRDIATEIEQEIYNSGREKTQQEIKNEINSWYPGHEPDPVHYEYPKEVVNEFITAYKILRVAEIYAHRIDWLLSGDDGDETFMKRLSQDLKAFDAELAIKKMSGFKPEEYED